MIIPRACLLVPKPIYSQVPGSTTFLEVNISLITFVSSSFRIESAFQDTTSLWRLYNVIQYLKATAMQRHMKVSVPELFGSKELEEGAKGKILGVQVGGSNLVLRPSGHIRGSVEQGFLGSLKSQFFIMRMIIDIISCQSEGVIYCAEQPENIFYTHTHKRFNLHETLDLKFLMRT